jgi:hypothetical protein
VTDATGGADAGAAAEGPERVLTAPDAAAARAAVAGALDRGEMVTVFGRCTVEYDGRAASTLGPGDRLLVCKPDGTTLVHTEEGHQPVNWQPPGCTHEPAVADGRFRLRSERTSPAEELVVTFESVAHVAAYDVRDEEELALTGTEADLRERVLDDPGLVEPGFTPLATERATPAGAVDVYGEDADGRTVVIELKRRRVGPDAAGQLDRYVRALRRDLHEGAEVRGILVAPSVTERGRRLLAEHGLEFVALDPPEPGDAERSEDGNGETGAHE